MLGWMKRRNKILEKLGARIIRLRNRKKITQTELAYRCDLDRQAMWRIETGRTNPTTLTLIKISSALDISLKKLVDFEY